MYRRVCDAVFVLCVAVGGVQIWQRFTVPTNTNPLTTIPDIVGYAALGVAVTALGCRFITKRAVRLWIAAVLYSALLATISLLVITTGGATSKFIPIWAVAASIAPLFGLLGTGLVLALVIAFIERHYTGGQTGIDGVIALSLAGIVPLIVGSFAWRADDKPGEQTAEDRSYTELASELSQVAGKSEVVINAITDGVLALDSKGTIQLINPAAQQLIGWGKHDAVNLSYKSVLKMITAKNVEVTDLEDPVAKALSSNQAIKTDLLSIKTQAGKTFLASISVSPVGQLGKGIIVVFRDITSEKSDERQRAEFISTASHEMRTPVASIEGYLGLALNPATATIDEKARDFITKAHESAQHLGRLFQDLLDVSKADDGRLQNTPVVIDVIPFMQEVVAGLTHKATEKGLRITYKPNPGGATDEASRKLNPVYFVNVDRDHFREVADNLVENAIKYTPSGEVVVDVRGDNNHVVVSVQDTGIGIPREDQGHLFQKFYRVDNSDTREIGGTGLGLYLCRRLTENMGGRIWVESEYKKGSTFHIELPRIDHDDATRMIEQASIAAEKQAEADAAAAASREAEVQATQIAAMQTTNSFTPAPQTMPPAEVAPAAAVVPEAAYVAPPAPQYTPPAPAAGYAAPTAARPNTPLTALESNPANYVSRPATPAVVVPPRQQ
ncbi:MAG: ATP-binding protein [Candidatus Saccharimonas sp.]